MKNLFILLTAAWWFNLTIAGPLVSRFNPFFLDPLVDSFYAQPEDIGNYQPGQIIRRRQIPSSIAGSFSSVYQVFFRTTDGQGRPVGTVATVWAPLFPSPQPKVFSYQVAEDADVLDCAPSWGWVLGSDSNAAFVERSVQGPLLVNWATSKGWYVVNTDAEGPQSAWLVGKMEGQAGLDGIRATLQLHNLLALSTTVAMYGYSGGAHTTVWMASLAQSYASELRIVGAAHGGTPVDLEPAFAQDNGGSMSAIVGAGIFGLANGYTGPGSDPDLNAALNNLLTDKGKQVAAQFRSNNYCIASGNVADTGVTDYNTIFKQPLLSIPELRVVLAKESLLSNVSSVLPVPVPKFPRFLYHGTADNTVPYWPAAAYVSQQCAQGANIQFASLDGQDHAPAAVSGLVGAMQFIEQSFAGTTPSVVCGTTTPSSLPQVGSDQAVEVLGSQLSDFLTGLGSSLTSAFEHS